MSVPAVFQSMRLPFLLLTPVCVFLGLATALNTDATINLQHFILALIGAITAHLGVNLLNEYQDFISGLDLITDKTPFSGGSGALPDQPEKKGVVLTAAIISLLTTTLIGFYFINAVGFQIAIIGLLGLTLIVTYTKWINGIPFLCLIAPGLGFGLLMVGGTHYVLTGSLTQTTWMVPVIPFLLINNLLLLNQYPDIQADKSVGRNHFPIAFGVKESNKVYAVSMLAAYLLIIYSISTGILPALGLIALLPAPLSFYAVTGAMKHRGGIGKFPQYLGANVAATLLTPLLVAISLVFG